VFWTRTVPDDVITVPDKVRRRARMALDTGSPVTWVDQTLFLIGSNVTHHRAGDDMLEEAVQSAEALLALLVEMRRRERL
jgi:hypothetical protein